MASKTSKWMVAVATAAISVMTGGAAFAAPASAFEGHGAGTMGLFPDTISEALASDRTTVAEAQRQARQVTNSLRSTDDNSSPISKVHGLRTAVAEGQRQGRQVTNSLRSTDGASDVISKVLGKVVSKVGTKVIEVREQARRALNLAS